MRVRYAEVCRRIGTSPQTRCASPTTIKKVEGCIAKARQEEVLAKVKEEKWQGKIVSNR